MCFLKKLFGSSNSTGELPSPRVAIDRNDIEYDELVETLSIRRIKPPIWITTVAGSNSMEPAIDIDHYCVCSSNPVYLSENTIKPGDVIIYEASWNGGLVIHSVIETGNDEKGWFCKVQGWNNPTPDPQVIRIKDIKWVVLLIVWSGSEAEP